jgi:hypothetical protein
VGMTLSHSQTCLKASIKDVSLWTAVASK